MFIATLFNGKTIVEGKDVLTFNDCPDGITSLQLTMPYTIRKYLAGRTLLRNALVSIGKYDKYYCAKQAIANVMSIGGDVGQVFAGGQGQLTHEILAGIDEKRDEVLYISVNVATGDVNIDKFDYKQGGWLQDRGIDPSTLKSGSPKR